MQKNVHGGDVYRYRDCIDFSANCNPLGTPEGVKRAIVQAVDGLADYPQVGYEPLRRAIAASEGVSDNQVVCGNGAAELIFSLCLAIKPQKALVLAPTFAEYEQALKSVDCEVRHYTLKEDCGFCMQDDFLNALSGNLDMVFICNPNNPTGVLTEREFLLKILDGCRSKGIFVVVDECFQDFISDPDDYTLKDQIFTYDNLFILKAFTKRYAIAGVRLGYGISGDESLLTKMSLVTQPWNVSSIAQAAGVAALVENQYVTEARELIFKEADYLRGEMQRLGVKLYDSKANYIFFKGPENLFEEFISKGIIVRDCSNYPGLGAGYYRIAVKKHEENMKFVQALEIIMDEHRNRGE